MAGGEDAGLLEGYGRADASVFADDAEAAFSGAIVVRAMVEQHAASALRAILLWEHEVLFSDIGAKRQVMFEEFATFAQWRRQRREERRRKTASSGTKSAARGGLYILRKMW